MSLQCGFAKLPQNCCFLSPGGQYLSNAIQYIHHRQSIKSQINSKTLWEGQISDQLQQLQYCGVLVPHLLLVPKRDYQGNYSSMKTMSAARESTCRILCNEVSSFLLCLDIRVIHVQIKCDSFIYSGFACTTTSSFLKGTCFKSI